MKREYPQHPLPAVGTLIIHGSKLLLVKRAFEPSAGKWSIPGGVVELGEKVEEAVKREVWEEVGMEVEDLQLLGVYDSIIRDEDGDIKYHYVIIEYLARPRSLSITPSIEVLEYMWVDLEDLDNLDITQSLRELSKKYKDRLREYVGKNK
ncbi:MAG: NUDIX hydrolase [Nitrososphaeria archaeon]|nr:NUDIX hydrolase [Nitrososphaeria archaeon]